MNAGPKTACGGKRPQAGVFAQPLARDSRDVLVPAQDRLRRKTPVNGRHGQAFARDLFPSILGPSWFPLSICKMLPRVFVPEGGKKIEAERSQQ